MDFNTKAPIFMQIADLIIDGILVENLKAGERIQSVREMASQVQVNPNTVQRSFTYLQDRGIIFNQRGVGFFVADDAFAKSQKLKKDDFIKNYLPEFVRRMKLLKLDFKDIEKHF